MSQVETLSSREIRERVGHPIIDVDGHLREFSNFLREDIMAMASEIGGPTLVRKVEQTNLTWDENRLREWMNQSEETRLDEWSTCMAWWGQPTKAIDQASALFPGLLYERLDELGMDYSVLFPSAGAMFPLIRDPDVRRVACRAFNARNAELYGPYADRLTPVALLPTSSPDEAIDALEHAVLELGSKAVLLGRTYRAIPKVAREYPGSEHFSQRVESFGIDAAYDYDPFWKRCAELRVPVSIHHTEQGYGSRRSPSRYVYNHVGAFAAGGESVCKSLLLGGVTRRFPTLRFAFMEGGVAWAASLLSDLISHWEKRNADTILQLDPALLDVEEVERLAWRFGPAAITDRMEVAMKHLRTQTWRPADLDDWRCCGITSVDDFRDLFVEPFFFGCEADDRMNAVAFDTRLNPFGAKLQAVFGSDIGHWDVPDMRHAVAEAYELVERDIITSDDFRSMMFVNPVNFLAGANPDFFAGTRCETAVAELRA